jgi:hypothetical protein
LQRYGKKSLRDLGLYLEIFLYFRGSIGEMVDCGLILDKYRGLITNVVGIFWLDLFSNGKWHGLGSRPVDSGRSWLTVD